MGGWKYPTAMVTLTLFVEKSPHTWQLNLNYTLHGKLR